MEYIEELYNGNLYPAEKIPRSEEYTALVKEYGNAYDIFVKERGSEILDDDEAINHAWKQSKSGRGWAYLMIFSCKKNV